VTNFATSQKHSENDKFFNKLTFGKDAKKEISTDIAVSNQLMRTKRKILLKLFQKLKPHVAPTSPLRTTTETQQSPSLVSPRHAF